MAKITSVPGILLLAVLAGCSTTGSALCNGHDVRGWELVATPAMPAGQVFSVLPDGVIATRGEPTAYLASAASYQDYRMHAEWRWTGKPGNGGVLLHIASGPKDRAWPLSIQVQLKHGSAGDILPMAGAGFAEPLTTPPGAPTPIKAHTAADSEKPAGQWNSCDIVSRGGTLEVSINGVPQNRISRASPHAGRVGFQLEGAPYELRNVTIAPL